MHNGEWYHSYFHCLIPEPVNCGCQRSSTIYWILIQIIHRPREPYFPVRCCHLAGSVTESSKGHSQLPQNGGSCGKTSEYHEHKTIAAFLWLSNEFLFQKWCCMECHDGVDRAFYESVVVVQQKHCMHGGKSISRVKCPFRKDRTLPWMEVVQYNQFAIK